jgi:hypothetical protein
VRTTDQGGLSIEKAFTVRVTDLNEAPRVNRPIPDQTAGANRTFRLTLAADTFVDPDAGQTLSYAAANSDGTALPGWLSFDARKLTFSGRPLVRDVGQFRVRVTATDSGSPALSAWTDFTITVTTHAHAWQNAELAPDVDGSGTVTPLDVLLVINWINSNSSGPVPSSPPDWTNDACSFVDVSGDDLVSPIDVLLAINHLNGRSSSAPQAAEGEGITASTAERATPAPYTGSTGRLRLRDAAVDQAFRGEADFSSPADGDELLGVLACG